MTYGQLVYALRGVGEVVNTWTPATTGFFEVWVMWGQRHFQAGAIAVGLKVEGEEVVAE